MSLPTVVFPAATGPSIAITNVPSVIPPAALDFRGAQVPDRARDPQAGVDPALLLAANEQRTMDRFILIDLELCARVDAAKGAAPWPTAAMLREDYWPTRAGDAY